MQSGCTRTLSLMQHIAVICSRPCIMIQCIPHFFSSSSCCIKTLNASTMLICKIAAHTRPRPGLLELHVARVTTRPKRLLLVRAADKGELVLQVQRANQVQLRT